MNKKLLTILALLIVVGSITAVSASGLGDLFVSEKNQTVSVGGLDFNLPADYKEMQPSKNLTNQVAQYNKQGLNLTFKFFAKDSQGIGIGVFNNLTDSQISQLISSDNNTTTINGINGTLTKDSDGVSIFTYQKDGKVVMITSTQNKDAISKVIKA